MASIDLRVLFFLLAFIALVVSGQDNATQATTTPASSSTPAPSSTPALTSTTVSAHTGVSEFFNKYCTAKLLESFT